MVEILVALIILAVGLLGMAGMTVLVMKGGRGAQDLADATNVCQQKIEELKDVDWGTLGSASVGDLTAIDVGVLAEDMVQEEEVNAQGLTWSQLCIQQSSITGSTCNGQTTTNCNNKTVTAPTCQTYLDEAGPYKFSRTFVICNGNDFTLDVGTGASIPPPASERGSAADPSLFTYSAAPNCLADPAVPNTRPNTLACESNDILTPGNGAGNSPEKMIKILCTWRTSDGACHYVNFEALRMDSR